MTTDPKTITVHQVLAFVGRGHPGAIGLLKTVISGRPSCVSVEPVPIDERNNEEETNPDTTPNGVMINAILEEQDPEVKNNNLMKIVPPPIDLADKFEDYVNDNITQLNPCHILMTMERIGLTGVNIEKYYVNGCKENLVLFNLSLFLATMTGGMQEQIKAAIAGEYDMAEHVKFSPKAVADANSIALNHDVDTYGEKPLKEIVEEEIATGQYKQVPFDDVLDRDQMTDEDIEERAIPEDQIEYNPDDEPDIKPFFDNTDWLDPDPSDDDEGQPT